MFVIEKGETFESFSDFINARFTLGDDNQSFIETETLFEKNGIFVYEFLLRDITTREIKDRYVLMVDMNENKIIETNDSSLFRVISSGESDRIFNLSEGRTRRDIRKNKFNPSSVFKSGKVWLVRFEECLKRYGKNRVT